MYQNPKKRRTVYLNDVALEILDKLDTESKSEYLFTSSRTGDRLTDISKVWGRIRNKAGIPDVRLHDLRHSYASFLANSGCKEFQIQQALGHAFILSPTRNISHGGTAPAMRPTITSPRQNTPKLNKKPDTKNSYAMKNKYTSKSAATPGQLSRIWAGPW
jgi:integrase